MEILVLDAETWPESPELRIPADVVAQLSDHTRDLLLDGFAAAVSELAPGSVAEVHSDGEEPTSVTSAAPLLLRPLALHVHLHRLTREFVAELLGLSVIWATIGLPGGTGQAAALTTAGAVRTFFKRFTKLSESELRIAVFVAERARGAGDMPARNTTTTALTAAVGEAALRDLERLKSENVLTCSDDAWHLT